MTYLPSQRTICCSNKRLTSLIPFKLMPSWIISLLELNYFVVLLQGRAIMSHLIKTSHNWNSEHFIRSRAVKENVKIQTSSFSYLCFTGLGKLSTSSTPEPKPESNVPRPPLLKYLLSISSFKAVTGEPLNLLELLTLELVTLFSNDSRIVTTWKFWRDAKWGEEFLFGEDKALLVFELTEFGVEFLFAENDGSDNLELIRSRLAEDLEEENVGDSLRNGPWPISLTGDRCWTRSAACLAWKNTQKCK